MSTDLPPPRGPDPPDEPTTFRSVTRRDLRVTRFNRNVLVLAGILAGLVVLAVITVLPGHRPDGDAAPARVQRAAPAGDPAPWFEQTSRALPVLAQPAPEPAPADPPQPEPAPAPPAALPALPTAPPLEIDERAQRRRAVLEKAVASVPQVAGGGTWDAVRSAAPESAPGDSPADPLESVRSLLHETGALPGSGSAALALGDEDDANLQAAKARFLEEARDGRLEGTLLQQVARPLSPYVVTEGSIVPCVLEGGINSDLPGAFRARVRENVYDTATGRFLLIPQGTLLTGSYDSVVAFGQSRVLVAGHRLIFPDASSIQLRGMPLTDLAGYAGLHDRVDRHYLRTFGSAVLMAAISGGVQVSQGGSETRVDSESEDIRETLAAALGQQLGDVSAELVRRNLRVQPTITIRPGARFNVHVMQDMVLPGAYRARYLAADGDPR